MRIIEPMKKQLSIITSSYRGEKYLSSFFDNVSKQTIFSQIEIVFVANDPTPAEKTIIEDFQKKYPENIVYIEVPREPISISMNRAIIAANWEYIFNWDIDDLRTENSIEIQYETLKSNDAISLTYGDFIITKEFWSHIGNKVESPEFEKQKFMNGMYCGPFRAWKKCVHEKIGYFDEQLRSGADFDLMVRIATFFDLKKTHGLLGYYLNANTGLSTGGQKSFFSLQAKELRVINERYNILSKIDFFVPILGYRIPEIRSWDTFIEIKKYGFSPKRKATLSERISSVWFTLQYGFLRILKYVYLTIKWK